MSKDIMIKSQSVNSREPVTFRTLTEYLKEVEWPVILGRDLPHNIQPAHQQSEFTLAAITCQMLLTLIPIGSVIV